MERRIQEADQDPNPNRRVRAVGQRVANALRRAAEAIRRTPSHHLGVDQSRRLGSSWFKRFATAYVCFGAIRFRVRFRAILGRLYVKRVADFYVKR